MASKKYVVLGLGSFGSALAQRLCDNGCLVTGVDGEEAQVEALRDRLNEAIVADVTDREVLTSLMLDRSEAVFISLGERMDRSILCALHARELGARKIYVKGVSAEHGRILMALGVTQVVHPEVEMAQQLADQVAHPNILEYFKVDDEYGIVEIAVPDTLVGQTLQSAELPRKHGLFVLAIKSALHARWELPPKIDHRFTDDQIILVMGKKADIARFAR